MGKSLPQPLNRLLSSPAKRINPRPPGCPLPEAPNPPNGRVEGENVVGRFWYRFPTSSWSPDPAERFRRRP